MRRDFGAAGEELEKRCSSEWSAVKEKWRARARATKAPPCTKTHQRCSCPRRKRYLQCACRPQRSARPLRRRQVRRALALCTRRPHSHSLMPTCFRSCMTTKTKTWVAHALLGTRTHSQTTTVCKTAAPWSRRRCVVRKRSCTYVRAQMDDFVVVIEIKTQKKGSAEQQYTQSTRNLLVHIYKKDAVPEMSFSAGADVLSVAKFNVSEVEALFAVASDMKSIVESAGGCTLLERRVLASAFFEPSTRTSCSFGSAMARLGGSVLSVDAASSSAVKGESLADSCRTLSCYADAIVLRHPAVGAAAEAAAAVPVPVINAGDGVGEHPTQALLDLFTIRAERGTLEGTHVVVVGDLKNGRTVHSLTKLLARWPGVSFTLVAPRTCLACRRDGLQTSLLCK